MSTQLQLGHGHTLIASRIISILEQGSAGVRRIIDEADKRGTIIDASSGRRTRSVIVCDTGQVVLSAVEAETLCRRLNDARSWREAYQNAQS